MDSGSGSGSNDSAKSYRFHCTPRSVEFAPFKECSVLVTGSKQQVRARDIAVLDFTKSHPLVMNFTVENDLSDSAWCKYIPNHIAFSTKDGYVRIANIQDDHPMPVTSFRNHRYYVTSVDWNPFNDSLVTASWDRSIHEFSLEAQRVVNSISETEPLNAARWNPCSQDVVAIVTARGRLCLWDIRSKELQKDIMIDDLPILSCDWNADGLVVATLSEMKNRVRFLDVRNVIVHLQDFSELDGKEINKVKFSPQVNGVITVCTSGGKVIMWNYEQEDGQEQREFTHHEGAIFGLDMRRGDLASCGVDGYVKVWNTDRWD